MSLRVTVLVQAGREALEHLGDLTKEQITAWKTEYDVIRAIGDLGHEAQILCMEDEMAPIRKRLAAYDPHVAFNLLEEFRGEGFYVPYLLGYLELLHRPYTGCNPASLLLADNKPLAKKILRYHRIRIPDFAVFALGRSVHRPRRLDFPLIVKSSTEHGSVGIAQASVVHNDEKLKERVEFVHQKLGTDAIAEEYVEGREVYLGMLGNRRLETFPLWELRFENLADGARPIATEKAKWDESYQKQIGLESGRAEDIPEEMLDRIHRMCKRVYRILGLNGYARMDMRITETGRIYLLEANPNPDLAYDEEFADAAAASGLTYEQMIQRILNLGIRYAKRH